MALKAYVSFKGIKQGQFKGESKNSQRQDKWMECVDFKMASSAPFDNQNSGQPNGKRGHTPMMITKEWGTASPQLLNAHFNDEVLSEVIVEFVGRPPTGAGEIVVQRITLTNAKIAGVKPHIGPAAISGRMLSDITFTFQKIEQQSLHTGRFTNWGP